MSRWIKNFVLWFVFTAPVLEPSKPCCCVNPCRGEYRPAGSLNPAREWCDSVICNVASRGVDVQTMNYCHCNCTCLSWLCRVTWKAASIVPCLPKLHTISMHWSETHWWLGEGTQKGMSTSEACLPPFRPLNCCLRTQCALISGPLATVLCLIRVLCLFSQATNQVFTTRWIVD